MTVFGLHQTGPYEPSPPSSKARGCSEFNRPTFIGVAPSQSRACHLTAGPGTESGIEGARRAAPYNSNSSLISRVLARGAETWSTGCSMRQRAVGAATAIGARAAVPLGGEPEGYAGARGTYTGVG